MSKKTRAAREAKRAKQRERCPNRAFYCPQCDKPRLIRHHEHVVSKETRSYQTKDGGEVELLVDICDFCKRKNSRLYFEPDQADIKKVLQAMQESAEGEPKNEDVSLEDML